jgi:hypothetical protein
MIYELACPGGFLLQPLDFAQDYECFGSLRAGWPHV